MIAGPLPTETSLLQLEEQTLQSLQCLFLLLLCPPLLLLQSVQRLPLLLLRTFQLLKPVTSCLDEKNKHPVKLVEMMQIQTFLLVPF